MTVLGVRDGAGRAGARVRGRRLRARAHRGRRPTTRGRRGGRSTAARSRARSRASAGERLGETAVAARSTSGEPRWVAVFSTDLGDVDDNVALIRRQILIAGAIALLAALGAGYLVAGAHARRLRRLEEAAEKVADGDFTTPIPVDSSDEVGQLAMTFNEMQKRLAVLDSARKEFIANASHELRTPIFSLSGFVELLEDDDPDPEARAEFVRTMREQVDRLTKLTVDLLDLSKLDADAIEIRRERVDLADVARRVAERVRPARRAATARRSRSATATAAAASADPDRVAQIMRILIDNALTHTPEGTAITVGTTDEPPRTARRASSSPTTARASTPRSRERVFERFYTGDEVSRLRPRPGDRAASWRCGWAARSSCAPAAGRTEFELRLPARAPARSLSVAVRLTAALAALLATGAASLAGCGGDDARTSTVAGATTTTTSTTSDGDAQNGS